MSMPIACVFLPSFELQVCARHQPSWRGNASAVVLSTGKRPVVCALNRRAYRSGARRGMSLAQAHSVDPTIEWEIWQGRHKHRALRALEQCLQRFSPKIALMDNMLGCFWLETRGLVPLFESLDDWAAQVCQALEGDGWSAHIAFGENPFDAMVLARSTSGHRASSRPQRQQTISECSIDVLGLSQRVLHHCRALDIRTVGQLAQVPTRERLEVLGRETHLGMSWCRGPWQRRKSLVSPRDTIDLSWRHNESIIRQVDLFAVFKHLFDRGVGLAAQKLLEPVRCTWTGQSVLPDTPNETVCIKVPGTSTDWRLWCRLLTLRFQQISWESVGDVTLEMELNVARPVQGSLLSMTSSVGARHPTERKDVLSRALLEVQSRYGVASVNLLSVQSNSIPERRHLCGAWHPGQLQIGRGKGHQPVRVKVIGEVVEITQQRRCVFGELCALPWWEASSRRRYGEVFRERQDALWVFVDQQTRRWYRVGWG